MRKYAEYYYTTKRTKEGYMWAIRSKEGDILQVSTELFEKKIFAEKDCEEHIQEYYY